MKRALTVISIVILSVNYSFSQDYTFRRVLMSLPTGAGTGIGGSFLKLSGVVSVNDSVIVINMKGEILKYRVEKTVDRQGFKQFRVLEPLTPDQEIRITLNEHSPISKKRNS